MMPSTRLGGFKILKDVVRISLIAPNETKDFPAKLCRLIAKEKINLPYITCVHDGHSWGLNIIVDTTHGAETSQLIEEAFEKILTPFEEFIHRQTTSGLLLMGTAVLALALANGPLASTYAHFMHTPINLGAGSWTLEMSLHHWINDGLMALFFFVVGLELKREILVGELAELRNAVLPIGAAIGGMLVPALIYFAINPEGDAALGWGIPMATDIAFAIGALALLASRVPKALITFLVALAIVDDLGAVMVIALFYTDTIALGPLAIAGGLFALLLLFNLAGIRKTMPYLIVGLLRLICLA